MKECCKTYLFGQFGDEEIVAEIYGEYVSSLSEKLAECDAALASGDWVALDRAAHAIKGNALAAGDTDMAENAIALRSAGKLQDSENAATIIQVLKKLSTLL